MRTERPSDFATTLTAILAVIVAASTFTALGAVFPRLPAHRVAAFPRKTALAGTTSGQLRRIPAELPSDAATSSVPATETLSATERRLVNLRALRLSPPQYLLDQAITHVPRAGRRVVLTFDDGPSANTKEILSILRDYDAKATFFFVGGRSVGKRDTLKAVVGQGSEVGNHTWDHVPLLARSEEWDKDQIRRTDALFYKYLGVHPRWVRPQSGWVDQAGVDAIESLDRRYVFWDVAGNDTVKHFTSRMIADTVLANVRSGSIILLHETNPRTVEALPRILRGLERRGYETVTLTEAMRYSSVASR